MFVQRYFFQSPFTKDCIDFLRSYPAPFFCMRHGHASNFWVKYFMDRGNPPLSSKGKKETFKAAEFLKNKGIEIKTIYSSPTERAIESSKIMSKALNAPVYIEENLLECPWNLIGIISGLLKIDNAVYQKIKDIDIRVLQTTVKCLQNQDRPVLLIGHRHFFSILSTYLTGSFFNPILGCSEIIRVEAGKIERVE